jgi:hypothetical protein
VAGITSELGLGLSGSRADSCAVLIEPKRLRNAFHDEVADFSEWSAMLFRELMVTQDPGLGGVGVQALLG